MNNQISETGLMVKSLMRVLCSVAFVGLGLTGCSASHSDKDSVNAQQIVQSAYSAFAAGDMDTFVGLMAPDIVWNEAEGNPYADKNPYNGPDAIMSGLFSRLVVEWDDVTVTPREFVVEGERVIAFGRYNETWKKTGQTLDIPFVHSWTVKDGKLIKFQQYTDTAALVAAMEP